MKVLVTGGTGFTGKALVRRLLNDGHEVVALDYQEGLKTEELRQWGAKVVIGTVTDGDIRRGLLREINLQSKVSEVMFLNPFVATPEMGKEMVLHLMQANQLLQMPVVDSERRVVGIHLWNEIV